MRIRPRTNNPITCTRQGYFYITNIGELVGPFEDKKTAINELKDVYERLKKDLNNP